ncbi:MAG: hypothetical protein WAX69_10020 [Victivallales bacterium]
MEVQVISKQRVADHGEVLTGKREVNAMLDLVKAQTEDWDSTFLEPACGTGNFLTEILTRRLKRVENKYKKSQRDYELYAVRAVSSLYGIDIQSDNVQECRQRLFDIFDGSYTRLFKTKAKDNCRAAIRFILDLNIIHGDALTLKTKGDNPKPIVFSQWKLVSGSKFKRHDFAFHDLTPPEDAQENNLFSEQRGIVDRDDGCKGFIPVSLKDDYPLTVFWEIANAYKR